MSDIRSIRRIYNQTSEQVTTINQESPAKPGNHLTLEPGANNTCEMWTPWCDDQAALNMSHYIEVTIGDVAGEQTVQQIFQSGPSVYVTTALTYSNRKVIAGDSDDGQGEYEMYVESDGTLRYKKFA